MPSLATSAPKRLTMPRASRTQAGVSRPAGGHASAIGADFRGARRCCGKLLTAQEKIDGDACRYGGRQLGANRRHTHWANDMPLGGIAEPEAAQSAEKARPLACAADQPDIGEALGGKRAGDYVEVE